MRPIQIVHTTSDFRKAFHRLPKNIQNLAIKKDGWFRKDAFDQRLRTHYLKGKLDGFCSYSVNNSYRTLFRFISANEVICYDIGTHEIYR